MKKLVIYFMLSLMLVCGFNVKPVYAEDYTFNDWDSFVNVLTKVFSGINITEENTEDGKLLTIRSTDVEEGQSELYECQFKFNDDGVFELVSTNDSIFSTFILYTIIELYAPTQDYFSYNLVVYIDENMENDFTLEKDGIEYSTKLDEEYDEYVFETFKIYLFEKLKNYDNDWLYVYEITDGTFSYDVTKNDVLKFVCDAPFDLFEAVYIDGKIVDEANYQVSEGSTIIEFKPEFAKNLSVGKHKIELAYLDGNVVENTFEIVQTLENPKTSQNFGYKELALILGLLVAGYVVVKKTKFRFN